jgi:molecular chaperone GrpE
VSEEQERVVIRDNRKIDPVTGQARQAGSAPATPAEDKAAPAPESEQTPMVEAALLDERTRDLQRVQAEYANYRKRADRERLAAGELAIGRVLTELLPILDDLERAKAHGDLTGALKAVADKLEATTAKLGLQVFGEVGDPFDPAVHEAVMHEESDAVTEPTCTTVLRPGYKHQDRLLRPAMVGVTDPIVYTVPTAVTEDQAEPDATPGDESSAFNAEPREDAAPESPADGATSSPEGN